MSDQFSAAALLLVEVSILYLRHLPSVNSCPTRLEASTLDRVAPGHVSEPPASEFLILEDDELVAKWLVRIFAGFRPTNRVGTIREAREIIADMSRPLLAIISDVNLPDGSGLDVVRFAREKRPAISVLVLTSSMQPRVVNNSFLLGASFLSKPTTEESLTVFARKALAAEGVSDARVLDALERLSQEWSLTDREAELLALSVSDRPRSDIAAALGVTENTAKTQVKNLLRKSGARNLDHVVRLVLRRALSPENRDS